MSTAGVFIDGEDVALLEARVARDAGSASDRVALAWLFGARARSNAELGRRTCRVCGCWDRDACDDGCCWVDGDLCSSCVPNPYVELKAEPRDHTLFWMLVGLALIGTAVVAFVLAAKGVL